MYNLSNIYKYYDHSELYEKISDQVWKFFIEYLPKLGFEGREGQQNMALDIADAIRDNEHILIEAGVGIGKSYAYLVPLLFYNKIFKKPVLVSTSTISLQEQLLKDLSKLSELLDYYPEVVLAKGMSHFICQERALDYVSTINGNDRYSWLKDLIEREELQDRAEISVDIEERVWKKLNVSNCKYKKCDYYEQCYFVKKRESMLNTSGILLCNHDLLVADAQKKDKYERPLLSKDIRLIAIDEAHNLEEKVRSSLKESWTYNDMKQTINKALSLLKRSDNYIENEKMGKRIINLVQVIFEALSQQIDKQYNENVLDSTNIERFSINRVEIHQQIIEITELIKNINVSVQLINSNVIESTQDDIIEELTRLEQFTSSLIKLDANVIVWLELQSKKNTYWNISVMSCPKELNKVIHELFFTYSKPKTILTSATLTNSFEGENEERYSYIIKNLGFPTEKTSFISDPKESPYPYNRHSLIYYKENMPHPTHQHNEFINKCVESLVELLHITDGKTLILFTAKNDLDEVHKRLIEMNLPWKILKQQDGSSQEGIINEFKTDINSVLLGTGVFWEGISIEGKALTNLVIVRLPFPVPDPIIEYKRSCSKYPLLEVDVPEMLIKLRQGVGRLIRNNSDKGIITILDSRVSDSSKSQYKKHVWDSLPMKRRTNNIEDIKVFINEVLGI